LPQALKLRLVPMSRVGAIVVLVFLSVGASSAQNTSPATSESSSRTQPGQPPSPPDAPIPDQGAQPVPPAGSRMKRTLNKLDPHCIDAIFHTCWSSPAAVPQKPMLDAERQVANDIEVGYYYLQEKNYRAARSRLKEALEFDPTSSGALIGLAQAEQKLGEKDEARKHYQKYLELNPAASDTQKVRRALAQLN